MKYYRTVGFPGGEFIVKASDFLKAIEIIKKHLGGDIVEISLPELTSLNMITSNIGFDNVLIRPLPQEVSKLLVKDKSGAYLYQSKLWDLPPEVTTFFLAVTIL